MRSWPPINAVTTACWIAELDRSAAEQHGEHMEAREVGDEREAAVTDSAQQKEGDVETSRPQPVSQPTEWHRREQGDSSGGGSRQGDLGCGDAHDTDEVKVKEAKNIPVPNESMPAPIASVRPTSLLGRSIPPSRRITPFTVKPLGVQTLPRVSNRPWSIRDVGSRNGTYLNGEKICAERVLRSGDELRMGSSRLIFWEVKQTDHDGTETVEPAHQTASAKLVRQVRCARAGRAPGPAGQ